MIQLDNLSIRSGPFALTGINLLVPAGQYAILMGATGQGKTTILEAICGLRTVTGGRVVLGGVDMTGLKPADRGVGYLPQDLGLFPTMTVRGHLEFALRVRRIPLAIRSERVAELARLLGIEQLLDRHVRRLSGGEAQRVALGRALSFRPQVLLFDEPLNALDESTRDRLCELLRKVQAQTGVTTLHVTHSRAEARHLADKLIILQGGQLEERPLADLDHLPAEVLRPPGGEKSACAAGSFTAMKLRIEYSGPLRTAVGRAEDELHVAETTVLGDLLRELACRLGDGAAAHLTTASGQAPPGLLVIVNGSAIASSQIRALALRSGDVVVLLPPIAGG